MTNLKPCPFCGEEEIDGYSDFLEIIFVVECSYCHARTEEYKSPEQAEKAWNRRVGR